MAPFDFAALRAATLRTNGKLSGTVRLDDQDEQEIVRNGSPR